jgi:hypothetical protein
MSAAPEDALVDSAVDLRWREIYPSCFDYMIAAPLPEMGGSILDRSTYQFQMETVKWHSNQQHQRTARQVRLSESRWY